MKLLENRDFRRLWAGETVSDFGSQVTLLALPLAAVLTLHAGSFQMGVLSAASMLPFLLFSLPAGVWTDRRTRRRRILISADLGRAAVLLSVPAAAALDVLSFAQLAIVAFVAGTLTLFFRLAWTSYLPTIVPREQLVDANSKLMTSTSAAAIGGPSLAGALVGLVTAPFAILVDAGSFLVSAFYLGRIEAPEPEREVKARRPWRHDLAVGLRFVSGDRLQRAIAGSAATLNFFGAVQLAIVVLYASTELGMTPGLIGLAFAAGAVGALIGAVLAPRVTARVGAGPAILWATVLFPIALAILPLASPGQPRLLAASIVAASEFVGGIGVMVFDVNSAGLRQAVTPPELMGRTAGAMSFLTQSAKPLGSLVGGALGAAVGLHETLWIAAAGGLLVIPWTVFSPLRSDEPIPVAD
ncbi:MAG TPA: MFS transporter [Gaiellaceae bacterium]|nr:MFS transporter [Gaiellaceae bacterium]